MKFIKNKLTAPFEIFNLIYKNSPRYFILFIPQVIFSAVLPWLYVYVPKLIIEALTEGKNYNEIFLIIIFLGGASLILNLSIGYLNKKISYYTEYFSLKLSFETGRLVMNLSLSEIENTSERDNIRLAGNASETIKLCDIIGKLIQNIITLVGFIGIISILDIKFFIIVAIIFIVKIIFTSISYKANIKLRTQTAQNERIGNYLTNLCYFNEGASKEIRSNCIQSWFLNKVKGYRNKLVELQFREFRRNFIFDSINSIMYAISSFYILWSLSVYYLNKLISIADFTLYFSTITAMSSTLGIITDLVAEYNKQLKNSADFRKLKFLAEKSEDKLLSGVNPFIVPSDIEINFSDVWFKYPGCDSYVLRNINIKISDREKLVIVGYNGSGKSTFIKLLCKFYRPSSGKITLNGKDIWEIPNEQYYGILGAVFQDFALLAFTISENITMSENDENISVVIEKSGLSEFIANLQDGQKTYISKKYSSKGIELSGGQGQKIALARALYKNAPVLILDEPTANLDVKAESELYENFMKTAFDKTAIFISHRLAASQIADHIAVFSNGEIVEYGTHKELIAKNGLYAEMFEKQRKPYI
jgi:ABC-type multidrug transport system fused ATPase/permease subunit